MTIDHKVRFGRSGSDEPKYRRRDYRRGKYADALGQEPHHEKHRRSEILCSGAETIFEQLVGCQNVAAKICRNENETDDKSER